MFRTHRAIVHRDRTFSEPLTGCYVCTTDQHIRLQRVRVYRRFRFAFSLITCRLKPFDTFGRTRVIWALQVDTFASGICVSLERAG